MDFRELTEFIKDFFSYIVVVVTLILVFIFIVSIQSISGNSMYPTLQEGDAVMVSKLFYKVRGIKRNDIVNVLNDDGKSYVKRVIGLPGEAVKYMNNILYIDDKAFNEDFLKPNITTSNFFFEDICPVEDCIDGVIPVGMYLVLGDNREESEDSRTKGFGLRSKKDIKGQVILKLWPLSDINYMK